MSRVSDARMNAGAGAAGAAGGPSDLRDVDLDQFLQLLITELQNQDPLDPMNNAEILQQIGQIREISATNRLSETLDAVMLGQNMTTASGLIGKQVRALSDATEEVAGVVDRVTVDIDESDPNVRLLRVHVGPHSISLNNIREVVTAAQVPSESS